MTKPHKQTTEIKIEKGIPLPKAKGGRPGTVIVLLRTLKVGDSFVWPRREIDKSAHLCGIKIATRAQPDGTFRIWRIA